MEKRTYIQPKMAVAMLNAESSLMIPGSPGLDQNTNYNPGGAPKRMNPVLPTDTVHVF